MSQQWAIGLKQTPTTDFGPLPIPELLPQTLFLKTLQVFRARTFNVQFLGIEGDHKASK